jgi:hypothetical protein
MANTQTRQPVRGLTFKDAWTAILKTGRIIRELPKESGGVTKRPGETARCFFGSCLGNLPGGVPGVSGISRKTIFTYPLRGILRGNHV